MEHYRGAHPQPHHSPPLDLFRLPKFDYYLSSRASQLRHRLLARHDRGTVYPFASDGRPPPRAYRDRLILDRHPPAAEEGGRPAVLARALHHGDLRPGCRILRLEDQPARRVALRGAPVLPARAHPPGVLRAVLRALPQGGRAAGARVHAPRRVPAPVPVPRSRGRDVSVQRWQAQPDLRGSQAHPAGQHG